MTEERRISNWRITSYVQDGKEAWICFRERTPRLPGCLSRRIYDTESFSSKDDAVLKCRSLNAELVQDSWMADGHPQNC